jgi:GNAT superfamily N-acetyltransferase
MPSPYRTRKVDGKDEATAEILLRLNALCFDAGDAPISPYTGDWWLTYLDREPVAFAGLSASSQMSCAGYLCRAGVAPGHRGQGLQLRLLRVREAQARRYGWTWLFTDTTSNPASSNSLIKAGYRLYLPPYPWAFSHSLYWRKQIT